MPSWASRPQVSRVGGRWRGGVAREIGRVGGESLLCKATSAPCTARITKTSSARVGSQSLPLWDIDSALFLILFPRGLMYIMNAGIINYRGYSPQRQNKVTNLGATLLGISYHLYTPTMPVTGYPVTWLKAICAGRPHIRQDISLQTKRSHRRR